MFYGKKLSAILTVLTLLFLVNSCAGLQINPPGPSTQTLLIIPVELDAKVVSVRHHFYYIYEITKADDSSFSYDVEIRFPVAGDMLIVDSLPSGNYYVRKFTIQQVGRADQSYGSNSVSRNDRFSLESGKITIFSKSLKITLRNQDPGRFATINYNFDIVPVTNSQEKAILSTLKELPNFDKWEVLIMEESIRTTEVLPPNQEAIQNMNKELPKMIDGDTSFDSISVSPASKDYYFTFTIVNSSRSEIDMDVLEAKNKERVVSFCNWREFLDEDYAINFVIYDKLGEIISKFKLDATDC